MTMQDRLAPHVDHQLTVEMNANGVSLVCFTCNAAVDLGAEGSDGRAPTDGAGQ